MMDLRMKSQCKIELGHDEYGHPERVSKLKDSPCRRCAAAKWCSWVALTGREGNDKSVVK